jgi:hypothetical protein
MAGRVADHARPMKRSVWTCLAVLACSGSSVAHAGSFMWQEVTNAFGVQPCGGGGCYTNYARVADLDGDADLDVIFPNDSGAAQPLVIYENDGDAGFTDVSATAVGGHTGRIRQIAIGDVDGDGNVDMYAPEATVSTGALFINQGDGTFIDEGDTRLPGASIGVGSTRFGDFDDDGDLDIVLCDHAVSGACLIYTNDGDGNFDELADAIPFNAGQDLNDLDVLDVDRDFDLDLLTNAHGGSDRIWINDGTGIFTDSDFNSSGGLHYGPGVCDVDGDTDLDIWIDNQGPGYTERLWANDGSGNFNDATAQVTNNPGSDDNGIICADTDSDGDMDAVVIALGTPERLLVNDGTGNFDYLPGAFSGPTDSSLGAEMGDLDGDHRIDIVTGEGESGSFLNRVFLGTDLVNQDDTAPTIIVIGDPPADVLNPGEVGIIHWAISDDALSDHGPRLASAYANIDPTGVAQQVPAFFMGGDVFRSELPATGFSGDVTFQLCAEDPHGNATCSDDLVYHVIEQGGTSSSTGGGESSGTAETTATTDGGSMTSVADTSGDATATASATNTTTSPTTDATATASAGSSEESSSGTNEDNGGGCGCDVDQRSPTWLALGLLALVRRRRRA